MEDSPVTDPLGIPQELLAQVRAAASEDGRSMDEILREALERYLRERRWQKLFAYGERQAGALGLTEADIPRLIAEYRQQHP